MDAAARMRQVAGGITRKHVIVAGVLLLAFATVLPPWRYKYARSGFERYHAGSYSLIWSPPTGEEAGREMGLDDVSVSVGLDAYRLAAEFIAIIVVTIGLAIAVPGNCVSASDRQ